ncbi:BRCT domain-containing protein [Aspergillus granulosus]|uniref:BRCT domain-containing protein n=1 Tax=Aspergillus granulosus TaxID=176169 RepID=A0ABR4HKA0_9EURO
MAGKAASNREHPLAGVVLCFTSILAEERTEIVSVASQMGAEHSYDLTSNVTHLLVGEINTPKYKFVARERSDVVVLRPEWVEAVRQSWMKGGDTDIYALEEHYKFPTFAGLAISITGFEDMALRTYLRTNTELNGAEFRGDLTKTVTHLVARSAEGEKYKFATQWGVKIVTLKWFTDSIKRGMVLEETLYHPLLPPEKQGAGAWNRSAPVAKTRPVEAENSSNPRPRKLRRIASTKLGDQNENIWGDIVGIGFETAAPKPSREDRQASFEKRSKDAAVIQVSKSFVSQTTFDAPSQPREKPTEPAGDHRNGFLDGCFFLIHGFSSKQTAVLRDHLSFNGAQLVDSLSEFSRPDIPKTGDGLYTIVPYKTPRSQVPSTEDLAFECEIVTDMWLERCLDAKTLVSPESHLANTPIPSFPINGLSGMKICSTGFSRIDLLHLSKLVNLVGATYNEYLTPTASILLCNNSASLNNDKLRHTHEWGIPTVTVDWFWASIRNEKKQPFDPYLIRKQLTQSSRDLEVRAGSRPESRRPSQHTAKDTTHLQSIQVPNGSGTPGPDSINKPEPKQVVAESPQKNLKHKNPPPQEPSRKSPSPTIPKPPSGSSITAMKSPSTKRKTLHQAPTEPATSSTKSVLDSAVNGLLKQARAATSRSASESTSDPHSHDRIRSRRPRPLLGRAQSNSSVRAAEQQKTFSRASSIDTLNEDGCGSAVESLHTDGGIPSLGNSGRYEFEYPEGDRDLGAETETPPMTQLDYEDADAVAMREKFLRHAGKIVEKPLTTQSVVIGEVKDLEQGGWGTGRRTRNANKVIELDDDDF